MAKDGAKDILRKAKAVNLTSSFRFRDSIGKKDTDDLFRIRLGSKSRFDATLTGMKANADIELYRFKQPTATVLKKIGKTPFSTIRRKDARRMLQLVSKSNKRKRSSERIDTVLEAGDYYFRVKPGDSRSSTNYSLTLTSTKILPPTNNTGGNNSGSGGSGGSTPPPSPPPSPPPVVIPADNNNDKFTAKALTVDFKERTYNNSNLPSGFTSRTFYIGPSDEDDWFKFSVQTDSVFNMEMSGLTADLDVEIYNQNHILVDSSRRTGLLSETITDRELTQGDYFIHVYRSNTGASDYSLKLSALPKNTDPYGAGNTIDSARELALNDELAGSHLAKKSFNDFVGGADSNDYFKIVIGPGGGYISVDVDEIEDDDIDGRTSNLNLKIIPAAALDANYNIINPSLVISSSRPGDNSELLAGAFEEGTYYIQVYPATEDDGAFYRMNLAAYSTVNQPVLSRDINPGTQSSLTGIDLVGNYSGAGAGTNTGIVYFVANDGTGQALWQSEGTFATTKKIGAPSGSTGISQLININNIVYFASDGTDANGINVGRELWKYDGNQITLVKDINPLSAALDADPQFTVVNGKLYFVANDGPTGTELWVTDGTEAGTHLVKNLAVEGSDGRAENAAPNQLTVIGNSLYFAADNADGDTNLYRLDTSNPSAEPQLVGVLPNNSRPEQLTVAGGKLYFAADGPEGFTLWEISDPAAGSNPVAIADRTDFGFTSISGNPDYKEFTVYNNQLYFVAKDNQNVSSIWKAGSGIVSKVAQLSSTDTTLRLDPRNLTVANGKLYFIGDTGTPDGLELWISDGSSNLNLSGGLGSGYQKTSGLESFSPLTVVGQTSGLQKLYFAADDGVNGKELWVSYVDGGVNKTEMIQPEILSGPNSSNPSSLIVVGDRLFFKASNGTEGLGAGEELWALGVAAEE